MLLMRETALQEYNPIMDSECSLVTSKLHEMVMFAYPIVMKCIKRKINSCYPLHLFFSSCFISDLRVLVGTFVVPIILVVVFNIMNILLTIRYISRRKKVAVSKLMKDWTFMKNLTFRRAISVPWLVILFGLCWLFGLLAIREASTVFKCLFVIFNAFQGFYFFLLICILYDDARYFWARILPCRRYKQKSYTVRNVTSLQSPIFKTGKAHSVKIDLTYQSSIFKTSTDGPETISSAHNEGTTTFDTTKNVCETSLDLDYIPENGEDKMSQMELTSCPVDSVAKECDTVAVTEPQSSLPQGQQTRLTTADDEIDENSGLSVNVNCNQSTSDAQDFKNCEIPLSAAPQDLKQRKSAIPLQDRDQLTCISTTTSSAQQVAHGGGNSEEI